VTGTKKFDKPSPKQYTGNINARSFGKACMQNIPLMDGGVGQSEDCLTLNVVTPSGAAGSGKKLPVMVWM
jgi:para-nitrobenzyl esterase